jgi:AcrR family transcriptional regulator
VTSPPAPPHPYHHGNLRQALVEAAVQAIAENGPSELSLRDVARRVGVSHAAPAHHFRDKTGLLTAVAAEGYRRLNARLEAAYAATGSFLEVGVAYVRFAAEERPYFEVMFRPDLYRRDDPEAAAAIGAIDGTVSGAIRGMLGSAPEPRVRLASIAAWSLVHGLATLTVNGNLPADLVADPDGLTRAIGSALFSGARRGAEPDAAAQPAEPSAAESAADSGAAPAATSAGES